MKCIRLMRFILWYDGTKYPQRFDEQELTYRSCPPGLQGDDVQSRNWTLEWDLYREEGLNIENKGYRVDFPVREIDVQGDTLVCVHYHRWGIVIKGGYTTTMITRTMTRMGSSRVGIAAIGCLSVWAR